MIRNIWNIVFVNTYQETEEAVSLPKGIDRKTIWVLLVSAFSLLMINYFSNIVELIYTLRRIGLEPLAETINTSFRSSENTELYRLIYWSLVSSLFYLIIPIIVIKAVLKERVSDFGIRLKGFIKDYRLYVVFFLFMLPLVLLVSNTYSFQVKYPFYNLKPGEGLWPGFWIWQAFYFLQFLALEFFFRGFMVHGTKHRFGFYSVFVMMVPYCMIHFQKPFLETTGAIFAGIVLGTLSLKSRSVWLGVAIHYSVAITMDLAALWQKGVI